MPLVQRDGRVVAVADSAAGKDARIAGRAAPTSSALPPDCSVTSLRIFRGGQTVRKAPADPDALAAGAIDFGDKVRISRHLAGSARCAECSFSSTRSSGAGTKNHSPWRMKARLCRRMRWPWLSQLADPRPGARRPAAARFSPGQRLRRHPALRPRTTRAHRVRTGSDPWLPVSSRAGASGGRGARTGAHWLRTALRVPR